MKSIVEHNIITDRLLLQLIDSDVEDIFPLCSNLSVVR